jgi:ribose-phosphate pyrophosphokinase
MKYTRNKYPDKGIYAEIEDFSNPIIVERINNYEDLFFIKSLKEVCDFNDIQNVELFIPCLFQQQHDRRFKNNQSFEGRIVAEFINSCNFSKVTVFHPHSDVIVGQINKCHIKDNSEFIEWVLRQISPLHGVFGDHNAANNLIMMSSDAGGFKPLVKLAEIIEWRGDTYSASKSRDPKSHKLTQLVDRQDFGGKDILIIDDLCVGGGTFIGLAKMLKERNCGKLFLAISHITVPEINPSLMLEFDMVFTTNSKYNGYGYKYGVDTPYESQSILDKKLKIYNLI